MNDKIKEITTERGANYGKPIDHFSNTDKLNEAWRSYRNRNRSRQDERLLIGCEKECALHHGVYMIIDKLVRAAENPMHADNWDDIQGYARCIKDALGLNE